MFSEHPSANPEWDQYIRDDWNDHATPEPQQPAPPPVNEARAAGRAAEARQVMETHVAMLEDLAEYYGVAGERVFDRALLFVRDSYRRVRDGAWNQ